MKKHWLRRIMLASVMCVLLLLPAGALSQGGGVPVGWGTAQIDGVLDAREWELATRLPLTGRVVFWEHYDGHVVPKPTGEDVNTGVLLLMNDATHLFVGVQATFDTFTANPEDWNCYMEVSFSDEEDRWDGVWAAESCDDETTHEGCYEAAWGDEGEIARTFLRGTEQDCWGFCEPEWPMGPGVDMAGAAAQTFSWEWAIDLEDSYLDKIELGDCFPLGVGGAGWSWRPEWQDENGKWFGPGARGEFMWPFQWLGADCLPDPFASVCLNPNPCEGPSAINDYIQDLPESAFRKPALQRMKALENKLLHGPDSVANLIRAGKIQEAIDKLEHDIVAKLDGYLGGNPNDDWITNLQAQQDLADKIDCLVEHLESLL